jgi:hypothetical protein
MAVIKSGASSDNLTIDATSKAARVTLYDVEGNPLSKKATYRASTLTAFVPAVTAARPIFLIEGSASKTITVKRISFSGASLTAVQYLSINVSKYSTAASGGTSTSAPMVPLDSNSAAATAAFVRYYTAVPTAGTLVGDIASVRFLAQATTAAAGGPTFAYTFNFGDITESGGVVLRGTSQGLALSFPTAPASTITLSADIEWTEE